MAKRQTMRKMGGATDDVVDNDQLLAYVTKKQTKKATGSVSKLLTATHGGKRSVPRKAKNSEAVE